MRLHRLSEWIVKWTISALQKNNLRVRSSQNIDSYQSEENLGWKSSAKARKKNEKQRKSLAKWRKAPNVTKVAHTYPHPGCGPLYNNVYIPKLHCQLHVKCALILAKLYWMSILQWSARNAFQFNPTTCCRCSVASGATTGGFLWDIWASDTLRNDCNTDL